MTQKRIFRLVHSQARASALDCIRNAPDGHLVIVQEPTRSTDQNAAQWPILQAFADQLEWPVNGVASRITADDWKDILTCAFRNERPRIAQGIDGGMVLLGQRTSRFSKREFSDWLEFLHSVAADRGVIIYPEHQQ